MLLPEIQVNETVLKNIQETRELNEEYALQEDERIRRIADQYFLLCNPYTV
jgi:hypothetical protein